MGLVGMGQLQWMCGPQALKLVKGQQFSRKPKLRPASWGLKRAGRTLAVSDGGEAKIINHAETSNFMIVGSKKKHSNFKGCFGHVVFLIGMVPTDLHIVRTENTNLRMIVWWAQNNKPCLIYMPIGGITKLPKCFALLLSRLSSSSSSSASASLPLFLWLNSYYYCYVMLVTVLLSLLVC